MANSKISNLGALTETTLAGGDEFIINDISDSSNKKITAANLKSYVTKEFINLEGSDSQTISGGVISISKSYVIVTSEGGSGADDLDTINITGDDDNYLAIITAASGSTVTVKDGTGNIFLDGSTDKVLSDPKDTLTLVRIDVQNHWRQLAYSNNA
jgi:hypothetical protein